MALYASTIFLSAFLLFEVQPILGKILLPWFGGSAAVWTTCQLFFQLLLLLGYLYAHQLHRALSAKRQLALHLVLLAASLTSLPVLPDPSWKPAGDANPTIALLLPLLRYAGLPFFLLSTTGPLLQSWYVRRHGASPYRLFALSNFASLLALIAYPTLIEPNLPTTTQALVWSAGYALFVLACGTVAVVSLGSAPAQASAATENASAATENESAATENADATVAGESTEPPPALQRRVLWVLLAACPSTLLLAVTTHLTQDVASIPLLWLLPLTLYLLTFIVAFDRPGWYRRGLLLPLFAVAVVAMSSLYSGILPSPSLYAQLAIFSAGFFVCALVCHAEVARTRPHPRHLTTFYLMIAVGGALGGVLVGVVAPLVFGSTYELPLSLAASAILVMYVLHRDPTSALYDGQRRAIWLPLSFVFGVLMVVNGAAMLAPVFKAHLVVRNFYGALRVVDVHRRVDDKYLFRALVHGRINHGEQRLDPAHARDPITYYCAESGIGLAMLEHEAARPRRIGVVGLGSGTVAAYTKKGDTIRYYEINPLVMDIARREFTFLSGSPATVETVLGDARLSLEREPDRHFDVLVIDAFSSDAIPIHLLTREAFSLYRRHLAEGGVLAVHISNTALDLAPVVAAAAAAIGLPARVVEVDGDEGGTPCRNTTWALLSNDAAFFDNPKVMNAAEPLLPRPGFRMFTDDYSNLYSVIAR